MKDFARLLPRDTQCAGEVERLVGFLFVCSLLSDLFIKQAMNLITASTADISNLLRNNDISEEIVLKLYGKTSKSHAPIKKVLHTRKLN